VICLGEIDCLSSIGLSANVFQALLLIRMLRVIPFITAAVRGS
jgi:hypothetical protein